MEGILCLEELRCLEGLRASRRFCLDDLDDFLIGVLKFSIFVYPSINEPLIVKKDIIYYYINKICKY